MEQTRMDAQISPHDDKQIWPGGYLLFEEFCVSKRLLG